MSSAYENLMLIRDYLVFERRECGEAALALHHEGKPLKFEANKIVDIQAKIDVLDRALADERRLSGGTQPAAPHQATAL